MPVIKNLEDLEKVRKSTIENQKKQAAAGTIRIAVCMGTCGIAAGARDTMKAILESIEKEQVKNFQVHETGCLGLCEQEPILQVTIGEQPLVTYGKVTPDAARLIVKEHVSGRKVVAKYQIHP